MRQKGEKGIDVVFLHAQSHSRQPFSHSVPADKMHSIEREYRIAFVLHTYATSTRSHAQLSTHKLHIREEEADSGVSESEIQRRRYSDPRHRR